MLRRISGLVGLAWLVAASHADACQMSDYAYFVFSEVPKDLPASATILNLEFPETWPDVPIPRGEPIYGPARVRKVVRGPAPGKKTIDVWMPGGICTVVVTETRVGLVAGKFIKTRSGRTIFAPYWLWAGEVKPRHPKPGLQGSVTEDPKFWP